MNLGNKIAVVGVSASGKTTFAKKLAHKLNLPLTLVDSLMWKEGWNRVEDKEVVEKLNATSFEERWVIEGYLVKDIRAEVFERADTVIYLDYPPIVSSFRYLKRFIEHRKHAREELKGSPDKFSFKFLKLIWNKGESVSLERFLNNISDKKKIIKIKSPKEAKGILLKI